MQSKRIFFLNGGSKNTKPKGSIFFCDSNQLMALALTTTPFSAFRIRKFFYKQIAVSKSDSMKVVVSAPLDNASIPRAPLPENKSKHLELTMSACIQLNSDSLIRLPVGLISGLSGKVIFRDLYLPEIIRTKFLLLIIAFNQSKTY